MPQIQDCSDHARVRMQQRGIDDRALELLLRFGRERHVQVGRCMVSLDRRARRAALRECGRAAGAMIDRVAGIYAVVGLNGVVVTVGTRYRAIKRSR
jgi:hypothetical protein